MPFGIVNFPNLEGVGEELSGTRVGAVDSEFHEKAEMTSILETVMGKGFVTELKYSS